MERTQQKVYKSAVADGERWAAYDHRPGDIFICTPPKCGTTWMQTIVASLLWPDGNFPGTAMETGPWFDGLIYDFEEMKTLLAAQTHRRYIKTHTPADGIPILDTASYIVVARDGRDAFVSYANHAARLRADVRERLNAGAAARGVAPMMAFDGDVHRFFEGWIEDAPLMRHVASWWELRDEANVLLVHYNDLKKDLEGEMRRVAAFLDIAVPEADWPAVVARCTFEGMRENSAKVGDFERVFEGGAKSFLFKGTNGRWREILTDEELRRYHRRVEEILASEAMRWLEHGTRTRESGKVRNRSVRRRSSGRVPRGFVGRESEGVEAKRGEGVPTPDSRSECLPTPRRCPPGQSGIFRELSTWQMWHFPFRPTLR